MSYDAGLYAQLHRGTAGDLAFYVEAVRGARHVLELGCGYGRILCAIACAGQRITGLEIAPDMLTLMHAARQSLTATQQARITIRQGDMRTFALDEQFDRIIIPFNGLYCMLSQAAVVDCLRRVRRHLSADGTLLFDAYAIDDFHAEADPQEVDDDDEPIQSLLWDNKIYDVYESCIWDKHKQRLDVCYRHVPRAEGDILLGSLSHRYLLTEQLPGIFEHAGLELIQLHQDFNGTPLTPNAEHMVCVAKVA